jgi:hypothetical protein
MYFRIVKFLGIYYSVYSTKEIWAILFRDQAILFCRFVVGLVKDSNAVCLKKIEYYSDVTSATAFAVVLL